jgi:hypothetical protein
MGVYLKSVAQCGKKIACSRKKIAGICPLRGLYFFFATVTGIRVFISEKVMREMRELSEKRTSTHCIYQPHKSAEADQV